MRAIKFQARLNSHGLKRRFGGDPGHVNLHLTIQNAEEADSIYSLLNRVGNKKTVVYMRIVEGDG